ncbi:MAG TPA: phosphatidylserine/phosphatidylglycerophosphate/cardiolipin synthase family protein [Candidatus Saccharimonadales bacterium]|nr:phosphatidylserine/phosphatidylglycerophosphate/cardiolipin synthase family protein [Candidatus Saccharimonadales bacterium]
MQTGASSACHWLRAGDEIFPAMLSAIEAASQSVFLEIYTFEECPLGRAFREVLAHVCGHGVRVCVLVDAIGSFMLSDHFWEPLRKAGGEVRWFNPIALKRVTIRNHRKLLVCDGRTAFIGGFNVSPEYEGDGVNDGWWDVGMKIEGPLATRLAASFEDMFARADFRHRHVTRWREFRAKQTVALPPEQILFSGPGRGQSPLKRALRRDLAGAKNVQLMVAYFLPSWRLRRDLMRVVRRGGRVQLILAGKSDVQLSKLAAQSLYRQLLRKGVEIYEYQPQILHAKLFIVDDVVYAGSSNLDARSLQINYELMIRFQDGEMIRQAREIFDETLKRCRRVTREEWRESRTFWQKLKQHWAYFLLDRVDPYVARRQWRGLPK